MALFEKLEEREEAAAERNAREWNSRAFYLRVRKKVWIVPAAAALGALLFGLVYLAVTTICAPAREYKAVAKLYIDFAYDETGTVYDYYNGATWTDLLTAEPAISAPLEAALPEGKTLEDVKNEVKAEILTDIRLMTVTVTDPDPETAGAMLDAVCGALTKFGDTAKEFTQIRFMSKEDPALVVYSYRTKNACLLGLFLGFLAGLFGLLIGETVNDGIFIPEDAERRFGESVLLILRNDGTAERGDVFAEALGEEGSVAVLAVEEELKERDRERILAARKGTAECTAECREMIFLTIRNGVLPDSDALKNARYVCPVLTCGSGRGAVTDRALSVLRARGIRVSGLILADADGRFLDSYYGLPGKRSGR